MRDIARHEVGEERTGRALEDIDGRTFGRWHRLRYDVLSIKGIQETGAELLDHVGALTLQDPQLEGAQGRLALRTAAECALGALTLGTCPGGDYEVFFPLIGEELSSEDFDFGDSVDQAPTAQVWVDAFTLSVITGLVWEQARVIGPLLKTDYAPMFHAGLPYSSLSSVSDPAELAEMDALCAYLHLVETTRSPWVASGVPPLRKPDAEERAAAAARLDGAGALTADQRLLRVLLDDDQPAFEQALTNRLLEHRDGAGPDAAPRTLLPVTAVALAALAVQAHGWELNVRSGYLPADLLRAPGE
ncbi:immunity 49 family protein [Streptomyces sp. NBC_01214]|uniref:Imm49 family immunity protein n=1 Tax=Streptomyces sp. NBC_01214 TaxID=2903777 RepID=UPI002259913B|nr:Imm49 family immunity protein [Streptomyces sp. NBC_01214]MCX4803902.1 immunity 49 family protein [Streptomyces sp. NBC_01214]